MSYRKTGSRGRPRPARRRRAEGAGAGRPAHWGGVAAYRSARRPAHAFDAELDEATTIGNNMVSLVRLYKALGGGAPETPASLALPLASPPPKD